MEQSSKNLEQFRYQKSNFLNDAITKRGFKFAEVNSSANNLFNDA
jgi:hypothetical protein